MLQPNPFARLIGPLRYACERGFARLPTVRNLRAPLEQALSEAKLLGLASGILAPLKRELRNITIESDEAKLVRLLEPEAVNGDAS